MRGRDIERRDRKTKLLWELRMSAVPYCAPHVRGVENPTERQTAIWHAYEDLSETGLVDRVGGRDVYMITPAGVRYIDDADTADRRDSGRKRG